MVSVERVQDAVRSEDDANPDLEACLKAYVSKVKASTKRELKIEYDAVLPDALGGNTDEGNAQNNNQNTTPSLLKVTGVITDIRTAVENGNSVYYIALDGKAVYYSMSAVTDNNVVILNVGDEVTINYKTQEGKIIPAKSIK